MTFRVPQGIIPVQDDLLPNDHSTIYSLCQSTDEMCQNYIQLHKDKTTVIVFSNKDEILKNANLDSSGQEKKDQVRNFGVILELGLNFSSHVKLNQHIIISEILQDEYSVHS